jgi:MFS family permease
VRVNSGHTGSVSSATMAALMLAVFIVSVGFGAVLPLLPYLLERLLGEGGSAVRVSRHTGLLTAVYTLSLFLFAPMWGRLSDRRGPRGILLVGLVGFGITMLVFSLVESLIAMYVERFISGVFAAAVTPVAAAVVGRFNTNEQGRARRLAFLSMSSMTAFLLGPMLGVLVTRFAGEFFTGAIPAGSVAIPLATTALLAFLVTCTVAFAVPKGERRHRSKKPAEASVEGRGWLVSKLLFLSFVVSAGVGVFEVGLALRGKQELGFSSLQIALMFAECSLVMLMMQALVFSPWFRPDMTRWLLTPALCVLTAGLILVPSASDFNWMLVVIASVAASAGILSPILTYWISAKAGSAQGWELGKQTAASSVGVTLGSAIGGLLFNSAALPAGAFALSAGLTLLGFLLSLGLSHSLVLTYPRVPERQDRGL